MAGEHFIALEIHDGSLWEPSRVLPIIELMERWGYNALVLHENDLLDATTQLGLTANYGVSDLRLKKVRNAAAWLNRLTARLNRFGAELFLEIKEPSFHDYALELHPELLGTDGQPDPTHPAWADFCRAKTRDLLARVPDLGGLIVNLSSPESRVSMPDHAATHQAPMDQAAWFDSTIAAFQEPLSEKGKSLYIRDFSYTADMQSDVLAAIDRSPGQVRASVKITAHDYFPRSPENPALRATNAPIVEFDTFGEHTGWGVIPNCRVDEFRRRMPTYRDIGASGMLVRTSWEAIKSANAVDTLSAANVFALPRLAQDDVDARTLVLDWLADSFTLTGDLAAQAADLMLQSWEIPAAAYWHDLVFPRHSCLPSTWQEGWLSMETIGMGRRDQTVSIPDDDTRLSESARDKLFGEKENATALAKRLADQANTLSHQLPPDLRNLFNTFAWLESFARQFELATKATFHAARGDQAEVSRLQSELLQLADTIEQKLKDAGDLPHYHHVLLDPAQTRLFATSLGGT